MLSTTARPYLIGFTAVVGLGIAGALSGWLSPRPKPTRTEERTSEVRTQAESEATSELVAMVRQLRTENSTLSAQLQASTKQANDVNTRIERETIRYAPHPTSGPAPVVVVRDGQPPPAVSNPGGVPVEVVKEIITSLDKSRTETETSKTETARSDSMTETERASTEKRTETANVETERKTEERVEVKPVTAPELPRFGAGYTSARQPFVSYDLTRGPKLLGLDRVGVGVFATKGSTGGIDGGPQASLSLSKGKRLEPFAMLGYQVREKTPVVGIGVKF